MEYSLTVDAIMMQLLSLNKDSLELDGWTSMNKLATTPVIAYYMDLYLALLEGKLTFAEVDRLFISCFET